MDDLLHTLLQSSTENEVLKFKTAEFQFDKNKLGQYFPALSNEANLTNKKSAYLVLGVNDKKEIIGTKINDHQINEYKAEMVRHTSPRCSFSEVEVFNTKNLRVIVFKIPAAPLGFPVSWKGHYYGRDGESLDEI